MYASTMGLLLCCFCLGPLRWALLLLPLLSEVLGDCGRPEPIPYATLTSELKDSYLDGTTLRYRCIPGYENIPGTNPSIRCVDTEWSKGPAFCRGRQCRPPDIQNGRIESTGDLRLGDVVTFTCEQGYRLIGQNTVRCVVSGSMVDWNREAPYCQQILCFPPPKITNGGHSGIDGDEYVYGTAVTYKCDASFSLIGNASISCTIAENGVDGEWSGPAPECKDVQCERPEIQNGRVGSVFQATYTYDNGVRIECKPSYTLKGSYFIKCGADGLWHPALPTCVESIFTTTTVHPGDKTAGQTTRPPIRPTTDTTEKTGTTQRPDRTEPKDEPGSGKAIGITIGAGVAAVAIIVIAAIIVAMKCRKKGKTDAPPPHGSSDTYHVVLDKDMPMEEK